MKKNSGQALVVLLVFMVVAIIMTTMAVALAIINASQASAVEQGGMAMELARSGAEDALLRLVRDPSYTGTQTFTLGGGTATATVSGGNPIIIRSSGTVGPYTRAASVSAGFVDTILTVTHWQEVF